MDGADAEVEPRVEGTAVGDLSGTGKQPPAEPFVAGRDGDLLGEVGHLLAGLQVALGVDPVDVPGVEDDQPPGRVEHVGHRGIGVVEVADRVGQHRADAVLVGEPGHPRRHRQRVGAAVVDDFDQHVVGRDQPPPGRQQLGGEVDPAGGDRPPHLGVGPEQHEEPLGVLAHQCGGADRLASLTPQVGGADQPAQRTPARLVLREQGHPRMTGVDERPAVRRAGPLATRPPLASARTRASDRCGLDRQVDAEDWPHARGHAGLHELHGAVDPVAVGQGQGVHAVVDGSLHQRRWVGRAEPHGVTRGDVKMDKGVGHEDAALPPD